jgi:hypothetical protein
MSNDRNAVPPAQETVAAGPSSDIWISVTVGWIAASASIALQFLISDSFSLFRNAEGTWDLRFAIPWVFVVCAHLNAIIAFSGAVLSSTHNTHNRKGPSARFSILILVVSMLMLFLAAKGVADLSAFFLGFVALNVIVLVASYERQKCGAVSRQFLVAEIVAVILILAPSSVMLWSMALPDVPEWGFSGDTLHVMLRAHQNIRDVRVRLVLPDQSFSLQEDGSNLRLLASLNRGDKLLRWTINKGNANKKDVRAMLCVASGMKEDAYWLEAQWTDSGWMAVGPPYKTGQTDALNCRVRDTFASY